MMCGLIDLNTFYEDDEETTPSSFDSPTASSSSALAPANLAASSPAVCLELWHSCAGPLISLPKKGSAVVFCRVVDVKLHKSSIPQRQFSILPPLSTENDRRSKTYVASIAKPLYVSSLEGFGSMRGPLRHDQKSSSLIEADKSEPVNGKMEQTETLAEAARKVKIGIYFATWWVLNVVFNVYNKKVLNAFPFPWLTSTLSCHCVGLLDSKDR